MALAFLKSSVGRLPSQRIRLLVKELGSSVLTSGGSSEVDETLVLAQLQREHPAAFARRVLDRLAALERSGRCIASAMVQANGRHDAATISARQSLVLAIARHARTHGSAAELLLDAPAKADGQARQELIGLVDQLLSSTQGEPLPVRLCFGASPQPEPKSGVHWRVLEEPS
ncbi:MAG TPA: hypothetical protein VJN18_12240 [Polyangiaceae bacterium]|nr:hypothetical protein [Polyangiaceae bacterium]